MNEADFAPTDVAGVVGWAIETYGERLSLALSLNIEDCVLLHFLSEAANKADITPRVFTLDTGRLPSESYDLLEQLRQRYPLAIDIYTPQHDLVERLYRLKGPNSFYRSIEDRQECCGIRKLEPLARAMVGVDAWMVGLRRAQGPTRADVSRFEITGEVVKLSPLAHLSDEDVQRLARAHEVPMHPLHLRGYPSIGCAPCTRAILPGEPARAGRWWWESPEHKECGLHRR